MAKTAKNILTLNHEEAMDFFMKSEQYHGFELPKYFTFDGVLNYIRKVIGTTPYEECLQEGISPDSLSDVNFDEIVYFPLKKDEVIKNVDGYSVRIKHGVFPDNSDYELRDSQLYVVDDDLATPFSINIHNGVLKISFMENDLATGMYLSFDVS